MLQTLFSWCLGWLTPYPFWIRELGPKGEFLARRHYRRRGYACLARNWRYLRGELDAVMVRQGKVLFLEVKTRTAGDPLGMSDALGQAQAERVKALSEVFLDKRGAHQAPRDWRLVYIELEGRRYRLRQAPF